MHFCVLKTFEDHDDLHWIEEAQTFIYANPQKDCIVP